LRYDEKLRKHERITQEHEYRTVIRNGRLLRTSAFKAYLLIAGDLERKAGFIAGKSVGGACDRNRARRVLKEAYRRLKPNLEPGGFKVVFVAKQAAARLKSQEISDQMAKAFAELGLLRKQ
jgi:ribonuclease P protein component